MTTESECKAIFTEIFKSFKEYSAEYGINQEAIKSRIMELLKTHRPVKISDYEYGFSQTFKPDHRLIIKEHEDKSKVRVYSKTGNSWYCILKSSLGCRALPLKFLNGILFTPIEHHQGCKVKDYLCVMEVQDMLKRGIPKNHTKRSVNKPSSSYSILTSLPNESALSRTNDFIENHSLFFEQSISNDTSNNFNLMPSLTTDTSLTHVTDTAPHESSAQLNVKHETDDKDYCMILDEPTAKKPKLESNTKIEIFSFGRPSDDVLQQMCEKLKIEYNHDAYKLWGDIVLRKIPITSDNIQIHDFKSSNIFACFSLFFTGKIVKCFAIQDIVNTAFRNQLIALGSMNLADIDQAFVNTTVSDELLKFIANFLSCRIGIYEGGKLKKYGKWESENNALTLVLLFANGMYSIVLDC